MKEGEYSQSKYAPNPFEAPLFGAAAHELKSPLALIRQLAIALEQGGLTRDEISLYARRIQLTSERALRLANDLASAGTVDELVPLFPLEPVNPSAVCQRVAFELQPLFQEQGRHIEARYHRQSLLCIANADLLGRIVSNLADNALKYAPESASVKLETTTARDGSTIRIAVRDYGPGLPAGFWQQLTRSATKRHMPITRRPDSSGLGLFLSSQFAEAIQGKLGVIRHRDGTTFYIDLMGSTQMSLL